MRATIVKRTPELPADFSPVEAGVQTHNDIFSVLMPSLVTDAMTIQAGDTSFSWKPTELAYRDAAGRMDYLVGSSPVVLQTNKRTARYSRTFPGVDDVFAVDGQQVKHWTILNEQPRKPAEYLGSGIKFGISGTVSNAKFPLGELKTLDLDTLHFPQPIIKDLTGKEIEGYFEVMDMDDGGEQQLWVWFDASFLTEAVFPVMVDPTVIITGSSYLVGYGYNDRKIVRLTNGWLIAALRQDIATDKIIFYKSEDTGATWEQLTYVSGTYALSAAQSIVAYGTNVYSVFVYNNSIYFLKFDATTVQNVNLSGSRKQIASYYVVNSTSLCVHDGIIHVAWTGKVSSSWLSSRVLYSKSTDGGTTWASETQLVTTNYSSYQYKYAMIACKSNGYPIVVYIMEYNSADSVPGEIRCQYWNGTGWTSKKTIVSYNSAEVSAPSIVIDSNDYIHLVWHSASIESTVNIRYSKSTDGGVTWSSEIKLTDVNYQDQLNPCISIDLKDNLHIFWEGSTGDVYNQIRRIAYKNGIWGNIINLTATAVADCRYVSVMGKESGGLLGYIWEDKEDNAVKFDYILANEPPNVPITLDCENFDAENDVKFAWTFSDPDIGDCQSAYQIMIFDKSNGSILYNTGKITDINSFYTLPGGTLQNGMECQWQVKVWDLLDAASEFSALVSFKTSAKPTVNIIFPENDYDVYGLSSIVVKWTFSDSAELSQSKYQLLLLNADDEVLWDSGEVFDTNARSRTVEYELIAINDYKVKLKAWNETGISDTVVRLFTCIYTPPVPPKINITENDALAKIVVNITNEAVVDYPEVIFNDLYRREQSADKWVKIATNIKADGDYEDFAVASNKVYEYKARAHSKNALSEGEIESGSITLSGVWLYDVADPAGTIYNFRLDGSGRSQNWQAEAELMRFDGRTRKVVEFGEQEDGRITVTLQMLRKTDDLIALESLIKRKSTLCYRDGRGRKMFGVITVFPVKDERWGNTVTTEVVEIDYSEVV